MFCLCPGLQYLRTAFFWAAENNTGFRKDPLLFFVAQTVPFRFFCIACPSCVEKRPLTVPVLFW